MRSIARRITQLEEALSPQREAEHWLGRRRKPRFPLPPLQLRFGELRRLPADYQGERHVVVAKNLPAQNGQEWVEFAEVPGPEPNPATPDRRCVRYQDVIFVVAKPQPDEPAA